MPESGEVTLAAATVTDTEAATFPEEQIELAAHSVAGISPYRTFKVVGDISGHEVRVLIDSGASHNFISDALVEKFNISVCPTKNFGVTVGDGYKIRGKGICKKLKLIVQGIEIVQDFLPLKLGNIDVILGIEWLSGLGDIRTNWKLLNLKFKQGHKWLEIQGDPTLTRLDISLKTFL